MYGKNPRQARRLMKRMGMKVEEISNVKQVIIKTTTKVRIIDAPSVTLTSMQGEDIYQIIGGRVSETKLAAKEPAITEEDVALVAQQAKVDFETARKALNESRGDLAQAIILLAQRRNG
jgi:nascent polypeptide-associated complex subunit alpha